MRTLKRLADFADVLNDGIGASIRWLILPMVLAGAGTAVLRYASRGLGFSLNLTPPTEIQWYLFSLVFLLGAAYGLNRGVHVRVDAMYERLTGKSRAWIDLVGTTVFLLPFSAAMLYLSWPAVWNSVRVREVSPDPGGLARWPIKAVILISFALLILQGISQIVKQIEIIRSGDARASRPKEEPGAPPPGTGGGDGAPPSASAPAPEPGARA